MHCPIMMSLNCLGSQQDTDPSVKRAPPSSAETTSRLNLSSLEASVHRYFQAGLATLTVNVHCSSQEVTFLLHIVQYYMTIPSHRMSSMLLHSSFSGSGPVPSDWQSTYVYLAALRSMQISLSSLSMPAPYFSVLRIIIIIHTEEQKL